MKTKGSLKRLACVAAALLALIPAARAEVTLLNVSYDPTREFYDEYNRLFAQYWKQKTGVDVAIRQSHGG
jgi:sulfate transport system substrate-binding protein